ncbi:hypothetical protein [Alteromonas lipotrueiana]|uniref:hypothetical protein n=1 Tax=Alteromonas lipotrueiana TaxID=2803815 RepID=UPI001C463E21|nr:hypothetical protein [Alteromonas lipotrueiana]
MKATQFFTAALFATSVASAPVMAQQVSVEKVVGTMIDNLMVQTSYEMQLDVQQAVANTVYFFEPQVTDRLRGNVSIQDLSASLQREDENADANDQQL